MQFKTIKQPKMTAQQKKQDALTIIFHKMTPLPDTVSKLIINDVLASEIADKKDIYKLHHAIIAISTFINENAELYNGQVAKLLMDLEKLEWSEWVSDSYLSINPHYNLWMYIRYHQNVQPVVQRLKMIADKIVFQYVQDDDKFLKIKANYYEDLNVKEPEEKKYKFL